MDQSKLAANHILGLEVSPYAGTFWNTRLKIAGLKLSCFGSPPQEGAESEEVIENTVENCYHCQKIIIKDNKLTGAILMGVGDNTYFLQRLGQEVDPEEIKQKIEEDEANTAPSSSQEE